MTREWRGFFPTSVTTPPAGLTRVLFAPTAVDGSHTYPVNRQFMILNSSRTIKGVAALWLQFQLLEPDISQLSDLRRSSNANDLSIQARTACVAVNHAYLPAPWGQSCP